MEARGHMIEATYTDGTLTVHGTNAAARVALRGQDHGDGDLVLTRDQIATVENKTPTRLKNGNLTVHTTDGQRYQLHYRTKHADDFAALAHALDAPA